MPKRISAADPTPMRVAIVTLDGHLAGAVERAAPRLAEDAPGLRVSLHAASEWGRDGEALQRCIDDIGRADIVVATMLFMEDHIQAVLPALKARRDDCDAMVCCMCAGEVMRLTRMGGFKMDGSESGILALLKRLRGAKKKDASASSGAKQMAMLRRLPQILRFIPGAAQDVRAYFLTLQYWLAGSEENAASMVRALVNRYAAGPRAHLRGALKASGPAHYPETGVYHPKMRGLMSERADALPRPKNPKGTVGLLIMRSYLLAGNARHYDAAIASFEARGLAVIPAFATGLDARRAVEKFFMKDGKGTVDAVVSLTGFSLVGGPAYNDARAAEEMLAQLDAPYIAAHAVEFQSLEEWRSSANGLLPVEATMMVAIPELDGSTGPGVFGGRSSAATGAHALDMQPEPERIEMLTARVAKLVALRRSKQAERKIAVTLFNFPPNAGNTGTAAHLSVFQSVFNTLTALKRAGYTVDLPASADALRDAVILGNASRTGANANVHARISADDHVRRERYLREIEAQWGPAPGKHQSDGGSIFVLGAQFGNVFVGVQPAFGYEGDPMRLLFEKGFAPTHAFSAYYRWLREDFGAHAVLHFGTHGALEFMPGKQAGMSSACWPDRLIGDLPNFYLYAANNPSEGMIAKRRAAATLISYLTPPVAQAGLYRGLLELKASVERWRGLSPEQAGEASDLTQLIQAQAAALELAEAEPQWAGDATARIAKLTSDLFELEHALIPHGLHVVGEASSAEERADLLLCMADAKGAALPRASVEAIAAGRTPADAAAACGFEADSATLELLTELAGTNAKLTRDTELDALVHALDARFVRPSPSGDLLRNADILPTGRNIHGFDPYRIPSAFAVADGARQAQRLVERHVADTGVLPETIALVLWGTDNLKSEGGPLAQALALLGARPRFDSYGRLCGASLIPLEELRRPRIDVIMTLSGIFRDLLPLQMKLLADAAFLAASADEPAHLNFVRAHALAHMAQHGCDLETAALRVFSNAEGAYGSNVNHLIDNGLWDDEDELAETYSRRKCFAYGRSGAPAAQGALLQGLLASVDLAYQNLESVELGVTTLDQYFDTLGGISRSVKRAKGAEVPVYIGDQTRSEGVVRTLSEQVAIETRTRVLNPKWYEGMLRHGYEGVRLIEEHVKNTFGWSATTGQVQPWVYQQITETFVLDPAMRERLAALNPTAAAKVAHRLIEAHERNFWSPDAATLEALRGAGDDLEDRLEGIGLEAAA